MAKWPPQLTRFSGRRHIEQKNNSSRLTIHSFINSQKLIRGRLKLSFGLVKGYPAFEF